MGYSKGDYLGMAEWDRTRASEALLDGRPELAALNLEDAVIYELAASLMDDE